MTMTVEKLPADFSALEFLVREWGVRGEQARRAKRLASSAEELEEFYKAMIEKIEEIAAYLDRFPLENLPPREMVLLDLALMFMEVAPAVELFGNPNLPYSMDPERQVIHQTRS